MDNLFKSGEVAKKLDVSNNTIRRWVYRYPEYFSEDARASNRSHSMYTAEDFKILVSIHQLSAKGYSLDIIEGKLAEGYRYEGSLPELPPATYPTPSNNESKSIKALQGMLELTQQRLRELTERLTETQYKLGVAEGKLETLKEYLKQ